MHRFEKTRLANMKSRDVTVSRHKIPALKPPLIKGLKMFCARFFVTLRLVVLPAHKSPHSPYSPQTVPARRAYAAWSALSRSSGIPKSVSLFI